MGLEHVLRGLQPVGRGEEALALGDDLDWLPAMAASKALLIATSSAEALMS